MLIREKVYNCWIGVKARLKHLNLYERKLIANLATIFQHSSGVDIAIQMNNNQVTAEMIREVNKNFAKNCFYPLHDNPTRYPHLLVLKENFVMGMSQLLAYCQKIKKKNQLSKQSFIS